MDGRKAALFLLCLSVVSAQQDPTEDYPHQTYLDSYENYKLYWKHDQDSITFEVGAIIIILSYAIYNCRFC